MMKALEQYLALFDTSDAAWQFESDVLSVPQDVPPQVARVRDQGHTPDNAYWTWLAEQATSADIGRER